MKTVNTGHNQIAGFLAQGMGLGLHWFPEDVPVSRLAATLVGMANANGGTVLLGIAPRSAQVLGITDPEKVIDRVFQAALLSDPTLVLPVPDLFVLDGSPSLKVLSISIPSGLPHVYSLDGSYLGRDGRQTNPISARRLRQLLIERGSIQFETRIVEDATIDDLDPLAVEAYMAAINQHADNRLSFKIGSEIDLLLRRGCLSRTGGKLRPTYAGLLLFGRFPQQWLPNATLLAAHFPGIAFSDQFIKQDIAGNLPDQLRQAEVFIRENLATVVRLVGLAHQETLEYPFEAVRELLVNSAAHRDYNLQGDNIHLNIFSDRLEVISPGGLPGPVTLDNLLEARFSRNAVIVQVLADLGFVERLGYGLDRVVTVMRQSHLRLPHFEEIAGCFKVTLFGPGEMSLPGPLPDLSRYREMGLNPRQNMALAYLTVNKRISNSQYQELCPEVHSETLRRDLADLVQRGVLLKVGDKRATYYIIK
jgi:ATP-dependent DNA helicase RecG